MRTWRKPRWLVVVLLVTAGVTSCGLGSSSDEAGACKVAVKLFTPPASEQLRPPERSKADEQDQLRDIDQLAEKAPQAIADSAKTVRDLTRALESGDEPDATPSATREAKQALDNLLSWTLNTCDPPGLVWGCINQSAFKPIGQAVGDPRTTSPRTASEAAGQDPDAGKRVEVARDGNRVLYGWVDSDKRVTSSVIVERGADGTWSRTTTRKCND